RPHDRLRRPRTGAGGGRPGPRPEVPQLARDGAVPQGARTVRPVAGPPGQQEDRAAGGGRGLHGRGRAVPARGRDRGRDAGDHAELLFRNAPDVYFCFDGDRAGRGAAWKALESVLPRMKDGRQAFFLFLPEGEDPDTIVRKEGAAGFDARLREAVPLSRFLFDSLAAEVNLGTLEGKGRLAERAKPLLAQIPDGAFADLMRQRLTELTGVG